MTPEQQEAMKARAEELKKWRLSVPMDKYKELRSMYNEAGVKIYAFKLEPQPTMSDEEYEYIFHVADTLGDRLWRFDTRTNTLLTPLFLGGAPLALGARPA